MTCWRIKKLRALVSWWQFKKLGVFVTWWHIKKLRASVTWWQESLQSKSQIKSIAPSRWRLSAFKTLHVSVCVITRLGVDVWNVAVE